jgi:hypothetical protein
MNPPDKPEPFTQMPGDDWFRFYATAKTMVEFLDITYDQLWNATFRKNMSDYHKHAQEYYQRLLDARVTELPPFPADLEAERRSIEESVRRKIGIAYWDHLPPPPPSSLMPGAPRLRPYGRPATTEETTD